MPLDLPAYLERIGHAGPVAADATTLASLQQAHAASIAFENLDPWLQRPVSLDLDALQRKLVRSRRGGYCYEHNLLLGAALRTIGFPVLDLAARVRWNVPDGTVRPRTHMLMLVAVDGAQYLVDAGFGGMTMTAPLVFERRGAQASPLGSFRLQREDGGHAVQAEVAGAWKTLYTFTLDPQRLADYEMASWYLCHHPESIFRQQLIAARPTPQGRWALRDLALTLHQPDGRSEHQALRNVAELREALERCFGVDVSNLPGLDARLAELVVRANP